MSDEKKRVYCEHCNEYISRSLYYLHRRQYYDPKQRKWSSDRIYTSPYSDSEEESEEFSVGDDCYDHELCDLFSLDEINNTGTCQISPSWAL